MGKYELERNSVKDLIIKLNKYDNSWKRCNFRNIGDFINKIKKTDKNIFENIFDK